MFRLYFIYSSSAAIYQSPKKNINIRENFKKNPKKLNYFYVLTPKGLSERTRLTVNFMKRKMKEYDELKSEIDKKNVDNSQI